jgi:hypothetical protein
MKKRMVKNLPKILTETKVRSTTSIQESLGIGIMLIAGATLGAGLVASLLMLPSPQKVTQPAMKSPASFNFFVLKQASTPLVAANLDTGTAAPELVFAESNSNKLTALRQDASEYFATASLGFAIYDAPAIGDVNGDGQNEIFVSPITNKIYGFNHDGTTLTGWPITVEGPKANTIILQDVTGDGIADVVFRSAFKAYTYTGSGTPIHTFNPVSGFTPQGSSAVGFAVKDIDADGQLEIITEVRDVTIPMDRTHISIFSLDGTLERAWVFNGMTNGKILVGDFRRAIPGLELIAPAILFDIVQDITTQKVYAFDSQGNTISGSWPVSITPSGASQPLLINMIPGITSGTTTDDPEVIIGQQKSIYAFDSMGVALTGWNPVSIQPQCQLSDPTAGDLNSDLLPEIIVGGDHYSSTQPQCPIYVFDASGQQVLGSPITIASRKGFQAPLITDFDNDGIADVLVGAGNTSYLYWWKVNGAFQLRTEQWPTYLQNPQHTTSPLALCLPVQGNQTQDPRCVGMCSDGTPNNTCNAKTFCKDGNTYIKGDADGSGSVDIADAVYLIAYIFSGGSAPQPLAISDADGSGSVDIADAVYLIGYIFSGGSAPKCPGNFSTVQLSPNPKKNFTLQSFEEKYPQITNEVDNITELN